MNLTTTPATLWASAWPGVDLLKNDEQRGEDDKRGREDPT